MYSALRNCILTLIFIFVIIEKRGGIREFLVDAEGVICRLQVVGCMSNNNNNNNDTCNCWNHNKLERM